MSFLLRLPERLRVTAYYSGEEAAWSRDEAIEVITCATELGVATCGVEVWLPTVPGPTIPTPFIYGWAADERAAEEHWRDFVRRVNGAAAQYIREFTWDPRDGTHEASEPYFNLTTM